MSLSLSLSLSLLKPPAVEKEEDLEGTDPAGAMVRCVIWLGLEHDQSKWGRVDREGEVAVFAETYENQVTSPSLAYLSFLQFVYVY